MVRGGYLKSKKVSDRPSLSRSSGYVTRGQAIRRLQLSLAQFRKLCILKGVYPREPTKKVKGKDKTYYYTKDILFLANDPILRTFRERKTWSKRLTKAKGRHAPKQTIDRIEGQKPVYKLDHIIRERYPTFTDALRELDDALSMVHLFAQMPSLRLVRSERVLNCKKLCLELQSYVAHSRSLRKAFVSIKGTYYQANIDGEKVTWVVPFQYTHSVPKMVDVRVMLSFLEFYESLMGFVNYRLYTSANLQYPPQLDLEREANGESLFAMILEPKAGTKGGDAEMVEEAEGDFEEEAEVFKDVENFQSQEKKVATLFEGMWFFLSREVPRHSLEFVIRSFGGHVSWDGPSASYDVKDKRITHIIVDRPGNALKSVLGDVGAGGSTSAALIQPQWVFDSVNSAILLPVEEYGPDAELPPHLSPFVDNEKEGYTPARAEEIASIIAAANPEEDDEEMGESEDEDEEMGSDAEDGDLDEEARYAKELEQERKMAESGEAADVVLAEPSAVERRRKSKEKKKKKEQEAKKMASIMIPNKKKRRLYNQIEYSKSAKAEKNRKLLEKREAADAAKEAEKPARKKRKSRS